jgi:multidrug transporter EmrE-like cation transporter
MDFILGLIYGILAQLFTFIQLQGQFKYTWMSQNPIIMAMFGFPLSLLYLISVKHMVTYFDGNLWPSRLVGFAIGIIVFTLMSWTWFKEPISLKTGICLMLSLIILGVQTFWK